MTLKRTEDKGQKEQKAIPFYPDHVITEIIVAYIVLSLLIILASLFPAGLEEKADPLNTPVHVKPEWYFLSMYQFLKLVPRAVGVTLPIIAIIFLILLPFLDRNPETHPGKRIMAVTFSIIILVAVTMLTVWGYVS